MQIRTLLLFISIAGSVTATLTVMVHQYKRGHADARRRRAALGHYNDSWHRIQKASKHWTGSLAAEPVFLARRSRTAHHKCVGTSTAAMLTIPIVASTALPTRSFEASRRAATNPWKPIDLRIFFGAPLQRGAALLFGHPGRDL